MLGESHSLVDEFPEYQEVIQMLVEKDASFAAERKKYDLLDSKIRKLELQNAPISDLGFS